MAIREADHRDPDPQSHADFDDDAALAFEIAATRMRAAWDEVEPALPEPNEQHQLEAQAAAVSASRAAEALDVHQRNQNEVASPALGWPDAQAASFPFGAPQVAESRAPDPAPVAFNPPPAAFLLATPAVPGGSRTRSAELDDLPVGLPTRGGQRSRLVAVIAWIAWPSGDARRESIAASQSQPGAVVADTDNEHKPTSAAPRVTVPAPSTSPAAAAKPRVQDLPAPAPPVAVVAPKPVPEPAVAPVDPGPSRRSSRSSVREPSKRRASATAAPRPARSQSEAEPRSSRKKLAAERAPATQEAPARTQDAAKRKGTGFVSANPY
jgi:hypothetical protein